MSLFFFFKKKSAVITLTTDFGISDPYVASMKGVILGVNPWVRIVDITHEIPPQDIKRAGFVLNASYSYFPQGTIHVVVVDPGVGSGRKILLVKTSKYFFLAPDNGVLASVYRAHPEAKVYAVTNAQYFRSPVSATFHGRDIFAPVAGYLSKGVPPQNFGPEIREFDRGTVPLPEKKHNTIEGEIVTFDRYGNAITNIPGNWLDPHHAYQIQVGQVVISKISRFFQEVPRGTPLAFIGSGNTLELSVHGGSAKEEMGLKIGDRIRIYTEGFHEQ